MLLKELARYRSSTKTIYEIITTLVKQGKIDFAKGSVSIVIAPRGKPYVYRIWHEDSGYDSFLSFVKKHPSNKHLVKLLSRVKKVNINFPRSRIKYVNVVKLEKLEPLDSAKAAGINRFFDSLEKVGYYVDDLKGSGWLPDSFLQIVEELINSHPLPSGVLHDLHEGNVMMRGKDLVITDPFLGDTRGDTIVFDSELEEFGE